jgi:hypothetical protein
VTLVEKRARVAMLAEKRVLVAMLVEKLVKPEAVLHL